MTNTGYFIVILAFLIICTTLAELAHEFVETSDGSTTILPCSTTRTISIGGDTNSDEFPDKITNILWYRNTEESPIYKYEMRRGGSSQQQQQQQQQQPQHWVDKSLENRFFLRVNEKQAQMTISPTKVIDDGVYHCRVDFLRSATKITHVNLTVIVPPVSVQISDENLGLVKKDVTEAYAEGASLILICTASGGKPLSKVSWWRNQTLITDDTQYFPERGKSQSTLKIGKLTRSHLLAVYSCEANNSNRQPPLIVHVSIDMYLRPLEVNLIGENPSFSADKEYNITCQSKGSRPPANISWWKDGRFLETGHVQISSDGNISTSVLRYVPKATDQSLTLSCKASNQRIPFSEIQYTWMLKVRYPPKVDMKLGRSLDPNNINEGADVYFECHVRAIPWVHRVLWLRNNDRLINNATAGILVSNQTLVLQGVSRWSSGLYACEATNEEGKSKSPAFHLKVRFEPVCRTGTIRKNIGVTVDEIAHVECKVDAEPPNVEFHWTFNSTPGIYRDLTKHSKKDSESTSVLKYIAHDSADYGTLQCFAKNEIGEQRLPCTYLLVPAGKPDPPHGCTITNVTHHSAIVVCQRGGFDGGLKQKFILVLYSGETAIANLSGTPTANIPVFYVENLEAAQEYYASIYSFNSKGSSKVSIPLTIKTLPAPGLKELRRSTEPTEMPQKKKISGPWIYIIIVASVIFIIVLLIGITLFVLRHNFKRQRQMETPMRIPKQEETPLNPMAQVITDPLTDDERNPDLIPPTYESLIDTSSLPLYTITTRPQSKRNSATQMPSKPYHHVTWAPMLQSRNCSTQTPIQHKESSV